MEECELLSKGFTKMVNASKYLEEGLRIKIKENIADIINAEVSFVEFPTKHIALLEGVKSNNLYFIIHGIVRGYYIDEQGNDIYALVLQKRVSLTRKEQKLHQVL